MYLLSPGIVIIWVHILSSAYMMIPSITLSARPVIFVLLKILIQLMIIFKIAQLFSRGHPWPRMALQSLDLSLANFAGFCPHQEALQSVNKLISSHGVMQGFFDMPTQIFRLKQRFQTSVAPSSSLFITQWCPMTPKLNIAVFKSDSYLSKNFN